VGNFDAKGLNVNNYWDDNRNGNLGVSAARQSASIQKAPERCASGAFVIGHALT
jgi:hypothetical protein